MVLHRNAVIALEREKQEYARGTRQHAKAQKELSDRKRRKPIAVCFDVCVSVWVGVMLGSTNTYNAFGFLCGLLTLFRFVVVPDSRANSDGPENPAPHRPTVRSLDGHQKEDPDQGGHPSGSTNTAAERHSTAGRRGEQVGPGLVH
jgi:hypothetical protein